MCVCVCACEYVYVWERSLWPARLTGRGKEVGKVKDGQHDDSGIRWGKQKQFQRNLIMGSCIHLRKVHSSVTSESDQSRIKVISESHQSHIRVTSESYQSHIRVISESQSHIRVRSESHQSHIRVRCCVPQDAAPYVMPQRSPKYLHWYMQGCRTTTPPCKMH